MAVVWKICNLQSMKHRALWMIFRSCTGTEAMVTSASAEADELQTLWRVQNLILLNGAEEDADAYAAKLAEITSIEIDVADAQQT